MSPRVEPMPAKHDVPIFEEIQENRRLNRILEELAIPNERGARRDVAMADEVRARAWWTHAIGEGGETEKRVLSKGTGAAGAYAVPTDFYSQITAVARDRGSIAKVAREITTDTGRTITMPLTTVHGTGAWTSENASATVSDDTFGAISLGAWKAETMVLVSEELLADSGVDLASYLAEEFGGRLATLEGTVFVSGDGSAKPTGAAANLTQITAATGSATSFTLADLVTALHTVPSLYREQGGAWVMSDGALQALRQVKDTAGSPILIDPDAPAGQIMLLGYPVYVDPNMPAPTANAKSLMFAGWKAAYVIRRVIGLAAMRQYNEIYALNGQVGFKLIERVDGHVLIAAAGVTLAHSAT